MTEDSRKNRSKRLKEAAAKFISVRKGFEKKRKGILADLEEAAKMMQEMREKFKWWGAFP